MQSKPSSSQVKREGQGTAEVGEVKPEERAAARMGVRSGRGHPPAGRDARFEWRARARGHFTINFSTE